MRHRRRGQWLIASLTALAFGLSGCTGDDDQASGIRELEPADNGADPETRPEPDPEPEPEPEPEGEDITRAGVHVPADAYEINDELDLDAEQQRSLLDFVIEASPHDRGPEHR